MSPFSHRPLDPNIMSLVAKQAQPFGATQTVKGVQTKLKLSRISSKMFTIDTLHKHHIAFFRRPGRGSFDAWENGSNVAVVARGYVSSCAPLISSLVLMQSKRCSFALQPLFRTRKKQCLLSSYSLHFKGTVLAPEIMVCFRVFAGQTDDPVRKFRYADSASQQQAAMFLGSSEGDVRSWICSVLFLSTRAQCCIA